MTVNPVGGGGANTTGATTLTTASWSSVAGDLIFVSVAVISTKAVTFTISDLIGNTYTQPNNFPASEAAGTIYLTMWTAVAKASGTNSVTVTISTKHAFDLLAEEYSGATNSVGNPIPAGAAGATTWNILGGLAGGSGNLHIGMVSGNGGGTLTVTSGTQRQSTGNSSIRSLICDKLDDIPLGTISVAEDFGTAGFSTATAAVVAILPTRTLLGVGL